MDDPIHDRDQILRVDIPGHHTGNIPEVHNSADRAAVQAQILGRYILHEKQFFPWLKFQLM